MVGVSIEPPPEFTRSGVEHRLFRAGEVERARAVRAKWELRAPSMLEKVLNAQAGTDGDSANLKRFLREADATLPVRNSRWDLLGPVGPTCAALDTFGNAPTKNGIHDDEGKRACGLRSKRECTVVAIGSNGQWGFEEDLVARTNCTIHVFDCTTDMADVTVPERLRGRVHLHGVCVGKPPPPNRSKFISVPRNADGTPGRWTKRRWVNASFGEADFGSYGRLLSLAGLHAPPSLLKIDAEGYEWDALPEAIAQPHLAPTQIAVEMHFQTQFPALPWFGRFKSPAEILAFGNLMARSGYLLVDRNDNRACKWCSEQLWVRPGSAKSATKSAAASALSVDRPLRRADAAGNAQPKGGDWQSRGSAGAWSRWLQSLFSRRGTVAAARK